MALEHIITTVVNEYDNLRTVSGIMNRTQAQMQQRITVSNASPAVILVRLMVGGVFLSEGIQKFLVPDQLGVGRFLKIGLPMPELLAPFVGGCEIVCGSLVLLGLLTRIAVIPLLVIMSVALATTKWPMLGDQGFWYMAHEARTDWSMFLGSLYLLIVGAGRWSLDHRLASRR
jgi:putative oxidoreductase